MGYVNLPKVIMCDFDGTLDENKFPAIGAPRMDVINALKSKQAAGYKIGLWSCREGELLNSAVEWCKQFGLHFDVVNSSLPEWVECFGADCRKVGATEYWDDRSVNPTIDGWKGGAL